MSWGLTADKTSQPNSSLSSAPWPEVLHHHVGGGDEILEDLFALRVLQVERNCPLVAVHGRPKRAHPVRGRREWAGVADDVGRADLLDRDHVGALIGQNRRAERTRHDRRQINHPNAAERSLIPTLARHPRRPPPLGRRAFASTDAMLPGRNGIRHLLRRESSSLACPIRLGGRAPTVFAPKYDLAP